MKIPNILYFAFFAAYLLLPGIAFGQDITFTKIADTDTEIPEGGGATFGQFSGSFGGPDIDDGITVFAARGGSRGFPSGVYKSANGVLTKVADRSDKVPNSTSDFALFQPTPSIDNGVIAFAGEGRNSFPEAFGGVYKINNGTFDVLLDSLTKVPGTVDTFIFANSFFLGGPSFSSGGAAIASNVADGVYTSSAGSVATAADLNTPVPGGNGDFTGFTRLSFDGQSTSFVAQTTEGGGIYTDQGGLLRTVADSETLVPGGVVNFSSYWKVIIRDGVTFFVGGTGNAGAFTLNGIYKDDGATNPLSIVIDTTTAIPEGSGNFAGFQSLAVDESGNIAFQGRGVSGQDGIYVILNGEIIKIIDNSEPFDGKPILSAGGIRLGGSSVDDVGFNDGKLAFQVTFADFSSGIYVANVFDPPIDPIDGLVSYWPFDDGTADDQVGMNDGVMLGGVTPTDGASDAAPIPNNLGALRLDGVVSEVLVPTDVSLDFSSSDDLTLAMWFKRESDRGVYHLLGKRVACFTMNYQLARDSQLLSLNTSSGGVLAAGVDAARDAWVHLATTYDATAQTARIYVNGILRNTDSTYVLGPVVAGDLTFGHTGGCPNSQRFQGVIDEVRIYDRALTGPEIAALAINPTQDILVDPLAHDFGQVEAFTSGETIITISNTGVAGLEVTDVSITSGADTFAVTDFDPPGAPPFIVPAGGDVFISVSMFPRSEGANEGALTIESDDPDQPTIDVSLIGNGLAGAIEDQATELEMAVNDFIAVGTLVGSGTGNSASKRLNAFADMVEAAGDLIEAGFIEEACDQLESARRRIDGEPKPPDFAVGEDADLIADQIEFLRETLECD